MTPKDVPAITSGPVKVELPNADQLVRVRALRTFHKDGSMQGDLVSSGDVFDIARGRAAELRANGLIAYDSDADGKAIHGEVDAAKMDERIDREDQQRKIADRHKTSPLRNPELKLAEVKEK